MIDDRMPFEATGKLGATAQAACGFRETLPSAMVVARPAFIWGMSVDWSINRMTAVIEIDPAVSH